MVYLITKKTSQIIDVLKVIAMIMVVFIHSSAVVTHVGIVEAEWFEGVKYLVSGVVSCCAVPIFFLISGILLFRKEYSWKRNIVKKLKSLMLPYIIVNLFWILIFLLAYQIDIFQQFFFNPDWIVEDWNIKQWINAMIGYPDYPMVYPLWFLRDLFILNILSKLIKAVIDKFPKIIFMILLFFWIINFDTHIFFLQYQALFFFCIGYYFIKYDIELIDLMKFNYWLILILYLFFIVVEFLTNNIYVHQAQILVGIIFWIYVSDKLKNSSLLSISKYTFSIFIFHEWSLTILKKILLKLIPLNDVSGFLIYLTAPLAVIFLIIVISKMMERYLPRVYSFLIGFR